MTWIDDRNTFLRSMKEDLDMKIAQQDINAVSLETSTARTCQYIAGEDHVKCGKPAERDSYCHECWARCHVPYVLKPRYVYR